MMTKHFLVVGLAALALLAATAVARPGRGEAQRPEGATSPVEYVVIAEAWHARNEAPPVLMGQLFHYVGSPNRYGIPAFYELHVWAWKANPSGTFADWHPTVSCDEYTAQVAAHGSGH